MRPRQYVIRVGNIEVEIPEDFEAATLQRIIEAVRSC
jgi:hypothetical protein